MHNKSLRCTLKEVAGNRKPNIKPTVFRYHAFSGLKKRKTYTILWDICRRKLKTSFRAFLIFAPHFATQATRD